MNPFPRLISIPEDYRSTRLYPASDEYPLNNPLIELFRKHVLWFEQTENEIELTKHELDTGEYSAASLDAYIDAGREAVETDPRSYGDALMAQNPEILDIVEWTKVSSDEWLAFSLMLRNTVTEMVNRLLQSTR